MGRDAGGTSDDEFEFDDDYFARTYRPLSNLPTPPLSSRSSTALQSPQSAVDDATALESTLLGSSGPNCSSVPGAAK